MRQVTGAHVIGGYRVLVSVTLEILRRFDVYAERHVKRLRKALTHQKNLFRRPEFFLPFSTTPLSTENMAAAAEPQVCTPVRYVVILTWACVLR